MHPYIILFHNISLYTCLYIKCIHLLCHRVHAQIGNLPCILAYFGLLSLSETYILNVKDVHAHVPVYMFNVHVYTYYLASVPWPSPF